MKEGWEYKALGECCDILDAQRKPIKKDKRVRGTIPYYGATGLLDYVKDYIFDETLVLLGEDGAKWGAGEASAYEISGKSWVNNHAHVLRPNKDEIINAWLIYYLNYANLMPYIKGVTVPKLNQQRMSSIRVPIPPLSEQQRIVSYLDSAFAKIDAVAKNAEASLNEAKALFQSALTKMMEPKEGWEEKTLSMLGESKVGPFGSLLHKKDYIEGGIPIINPMHIVKGKISPNHKFTVSIEKLNKDLSSYLMHTNDIVIGRRGEMGRCAIVKPSQNGFVCGTGSIFFRPKTSIVNPRFLLTALLSSKSKKEMEALAGGATMLNLSSKSLSNLSIDIPSLQEQCAIVSTLDSLKSKVDQLQSNLSLTLTECTALKQAILRQTFE